MDIWDELKNAINLFIWQYGDENLTLVEAESLAIKIYEVFYSAQKNSE